MTRPDLSDDEAWRAYRTELRAVGRTPRLVGFALIVLGAVAVWSGVKAGAAGPAIQWAGYAGLAVGWALMLVVGGTTYLGAAIALLAAAFSRLEGGHPAAGPVPAVRAGDAGAGLRRQPSP